MTFWPDICYCKSCRERYSLEAGGEMPTVIDWNDLKWVGFQKKREEWLAEFAQFTTDTVRKSKPNATVNHQFSTILHPWWRAVTDGLMKASDYAGGDCSGMNAYPAGENLQKQLLLRLSLQSGISIL